MSDFTDNPFYPSAERIWLCIRFAKWACDRLTKDADLTKNIRRTSFCSWRVCKQAKLSNLGHKKPARIHWKSDAPKTTHCLVRILVQRHNWIIFLRKWARSQWRSLFIQRHNWAIFLRKWARRGRYSQWRSLSNHVERIFVHKNWRGGYWQCLVSTGWRYVPHTSSYTRCFAPCSWRWHYQPQSWCRLATSELRFDTIGLLLVGCRQR